MSDVQRPSEETRKSRPQLVTRVKKRQPLKLRASCSTFYKVLDSKTKMFTLVPMSQCSNRIMKIKCSSGCNQIQDLDSEKWTRWKCSGVALSNATESLDAQNKNKKTTVFKTTIRWRLSNSRYFVTVRQNATGIWTSLDRVPVRVLIPPATTHWGREFDYRRKMKMNSRKEWVKLEKKRKGKEIEAIIGEDESREK